MKVFLVIKCRDGKSYKEGARLVTDIVEIKERYCAESFHEVYQHVAENLIDDDEIMTIHEEHPAIFSINKICNEATPIPATESK